MASPLPRKSMFYSMDSLSVEIRPSEPSADVKPNLMMIRGKTMSLFTRLTKRQTAWFDFGRGSTSSGEYTINTQPYAWTKLCTGNEYIGAWNQFGFNGHGAYRFADGLVYEGNLKDGNFHGAGKLIFTSGSRIQGYWENGINKHMHYVYADGLEYKGKNWDYCVPPERRYAMAEYHELKPIGQHAVLPTRYVPIGCYYTAVGHYNPVTKTMHHTVGAQRFEELISAEEADWVEKNCAISVANVNRSPNDEVTQTSGICDSEDSSCLSFTMPAKNTRFSF